ncbi:hypothetical protein AB0F91_46135 [Amycolatopsis sp. NPDC023774]|uniref:non-homologous end-joining DNA ligase LigD n=1 Tax=Amycolatopsis sp. NPDC023774 TaxID=3155015 RepID=UPI0033C753E2
MPQLVVAKMAKNLRANKLFIDRSQNHVAKTTIAAYSPRGRDTPTASTPITWDEVRACAPRPSSPTPPTTCCTASTSTATCSPSLPAPTWRYAAADPPQPATLGC